MRTVSGRQCAAARGGSNGPRGAIAVSNARRSASGHSLYRRYRRSGGNSSEGRPAGAWVPAGLCLGSAQSSAPPSPAHVLAGLADHFVPLAQGRPIAKRPVEALRHAQRRVAQHTLRNHCVVGIGIQDQAGRQVADQVRVEPQAQFVRDQI